MQIATGYTLTDAELFRVLDDTNPCFDDTNERWNDVISNPQLPLRAACFLRAVNRRR